MCFVAFGWSSRIETIETESGIEVPEYRERISKIEIDDRAIPHNWKNRNKTNFNMEDETFENVDRTDFYIV